jgi:hypothetical protein
MTNALPQVVMRRSKVLKERKVGIKEERILI